MYIFLYYYWKSFFYKNKSTKETTLYKSKVWSKNSYVYQYIPDEREQNKTNV